MKHYEHPRIQALANAQRGKKPLSFDERMAEAKARREQREKNQQIGLKSRHK